MNIETLGVRVSNPEQHINLEGKSFADLILFQHMHAANLQRCVAALSAGNPHGDNELLAEVQAQMQAMVNASSGVLQEYLRVAREQGLRFEIVPALGDLH